MQIQALQIFHKFQSSKFLGNGTTLAQKPYMGNRLEEVDAH